MRTCTCPVLPILPFALSLAAGCAAGGEIHPIKPQADQAPCEDSGGCDDTGDEPDTAGGVETSEPDGVAVGEVDDTLQDPWAPVDRDDVLAMAALTSPMARLAWLEQELLDAAQALVASGEGCPVESVGTDAGETVWTGDCEAPALGATVAGTLSYGPEERGATWVELSGDGFLLTLADGQALGLDGHFGHGDGDWSALSGDGTWTVAGRGDEDMVVSLDLDLSLDDSGVGGAEGYLRVAESAAVPAGDLSFWWTSLGVSEACPEEQELEIVMSGASEVRVTSGGDTPCDGELSVTVDGVSW